jgi:hypothetical protein
MDEREMTRRRGIRMAMQVATLTLGAGALVAAAAAEARADTAAPTPDVAAMEEVSTSGWSCWGGPVSRGPLAPPAQDADDLAQLLAEMPS